MTDGQDLNVPLRLKKTERTEKGERKTTTAGTGGETVVILATRGFAWMLRWQEVVQWTEANLFS